METFLEGKNELSNFKQINSQCSNKKEMKIFIIINPHYSTVELDSPNKK